jgi:outer membrane protein assembly factor BamE (lipoprotein component of BamABCDE complex)
MNLKIVNLLMALIAVLLFISGCSTQVPKEKNKVEDISRHSVFNLDAETIKDLEKGIIKGTPLRLDNDTKMSDVERIWGKPNEHFDNEDIQTYRYTIKNQNFIIDEDEMNEIYTIQVELDYSKDEILEIMGKPTEPGNIFIYEKENYIIQFEKFHNKWRLILRKK